MLDRHPYLTVRDDDQKRIREEFGDDRIYFVWNAQAHNLQAWYNPPRGAAYRICVAENVSHAISQLRHRMQYDVMRATDLLRQIDEHNDKIVTDKRNDAMHEIRHTLAGVAAGRRHFLPPIRRTG